MGPNDANIVEFMDVRDLLGRRSPLADIERSMNISADRSDRLELSNRHVFVWDAYFPPVLELRDQGQEVERVDTEVVDDPTYASQDCAEQSG